MLPLSLVQRVSSQNDVLAPCEQLVCQCEARKRSRLGRLTEVAYFG